MNLLRKIQGCNNFSQTERDIVHYILDNPESLSKLTVREIANKIFVSPATICRFCKKLGFKGFNEFKLQFVSDIKNLMIDGKLIVQHPITDKDTPKDIVNKMATLQIEAIKETRNAVNLEQLGRISDWIVKAKMLDIYAYDQNFALAQAAVYNFLQIQCRASANMALNSQLVQALNSNENHLAMIISRTGENKRLIRTAQILQERKVKTVLFTTNKQSTLSKNCDEFLYVANSSEYLDFGGTIFSVGVRYYLDVIFGLILSRNYSSAENFYNNFEENYLGRLDNPDRLW